MPNHEPESGQDPADTPDEAAPDPSDAATTVIPHATRATPTRVGPGTAAGGAPAAARIPEPPSAPSRRRRWPLVLGALVLLGALAAGAALLYDRVSGDGTETAVRAAITDFVDALDRGDLAALRAGSCGELAAYYGQVTDADFADVYRSANSDRAVPVVTSIDAVSVTDDTALAQVTVHTANDPGSSSVRSFALERQDGVWKVCS
ncbi:Rv0361 family membrane protein [Rhodococcus sp. NPDC003348]